MQIHHIEPIANKDDLVYYISVQDLVSMVKTFETGSYDFSKIISLQKKLLDKAIKMLNIHGVLIYMVCSFLADEGQHQITNFLKKNKNFNLIKFSSQSKIVGGSFIDKNGFYFILPSKLENGILVDGFFAAKLKKNDK